MTADPRAVEIIRSVLMSFFTAYAIPANITLDPERVNRQATSWTDAILRGTVFAPGLLDALAAAGWSLLPPGGQTRELRARILDIADQITAHPDDHGWTWSSLAEDLREAATPTEEAPSE